MINKLTNERRELDKGLTLIELLITIAVIGIVVAISTPIITSVIQQAQVDAHKGEMLFMADSIEKSIGGMRGLQATGFDLGTPADYKRYEANERQTFRFSRENATAVYSVTPSRITRLVPTGSGTEADPYTGFCITAWVGDRNIQVNSGSAEVTDGSCGLIPGPISAPEAPAIGTFTPLSNTVAVVSFTAPTGEAVGGQSAELALIQARATCTPTAGGVSVTETVAITNPITIDGLTENVEYTCTVAVKNNGDPSWSDESNDSNSATMFTTPSAPTTALGSNGPTMNISWGAPTSNGGDPILGYIIRYVNVNDLATFNAAASGSGYNAEAVGGYWDKDTLPFGNATGSVGELVIPSDSTLLYGITGTETSTSTPAFATSALALTPGQAYYIAIAAYNNAGEVRSWSGSDYIGDGQFRIVTNQSTGEAFIRTATEPDNVLIASPTSLLATGGTNTEDVSGTQTTYYYITVTWNKPYDGGSNITRYELQYDVQPDFLGNSGGTGPLGTTSKTITGSAPLSETVTIGSVSSSLPDSTSYFIRVRACNAITSMGDNGCGDWIASGADPAGVAAAATPAPPTAPSDATAEVSGDGTATVTWTN